MKMLSNCDKSLISELIIIISMSSFAWCLNITKMEVPSFAMAGQQYTLTCTNEDGTENDTFVSLNWYKFDENKWKLVKSIPGTPAEGGEQTGALTEGGQTAEPATTPAPNEGAAEGTQSPDNNNQPQEGNQTLSAPEAKAPKLYTWDDLGDGEGSSIVVTPTTLKSAGLYKCSLKSMSFGKELTTELVKEMRVIFKPPEDLVPELTDERVHDSHISIKCTAPASYPMTALTIFVNAEQAPHEDIHPLHAIKIPNTTYAEKQELLSNVQELRIRATKHSILNGNLRVVCVANLAEYYKGSAIRDITFDGPLYDDKSLTAAMIVLIIIIVLVVIVIIVAVVWVILRKKKLNGLNKVSELFNKPKTITVLVDNPKDE